MIPRYTAKKIAKLHVHTTFVQEYRREDVTIQLAGADSVGFGHLAKGIPKYRLTSGFKGASSLAN